MGESIEKIKNWEQKVTGLSKPKLKARHNSSNTLKLWFHGLDQLAEQSLLKM